MSVRLPPFDPEIAAVMLDKAELVVTALAPDEIGALRARATPPDIQAVVAAAACTVSEHHAPGPDGDVRVLVVRPEGVPEPVPVLLHLHGGGLVVGDVADNVDMALDVAPGWAVASVEYRLAPESPYPAAIEDAYAALVWLVAKASDLGVDPQRVVVTGVSAGGGLAAALALLVRDRGGPPLLGQLLVYPMLDDRNDSPSTHQMAGAGSWDRTANATGWGAYLGAAAGGPTTPPYASASRADSLGDLPPAFIDVASTETFRDECVQYAARLWADGGDAELHVWPGGCHGFDGLVPTAQLSRAARAARASWLTRLLARRHG
ncbi:alpha/beta hydrolase [Cellulomonas fengjieae]|uniref:alpha/beta hydrolase n=1 Tax=Cellulomonas fengjieae TaxID=2819978 RepID=UPI001AAF1E85|nr:alpha/beta hydrolase fold domain-containing protein [Cellulomonas fengjieae]MBO3100911.1 alpha/beta hydrolase fold domain-containing protein [Cellulomonas fengjieae]